MKNRTFVVPKSHQKRRRGTARLFVLSAAMLAAGVGTPALGAAARADKIPNAVTAAPRVLQFDIKPGLIDAVIAEFRRVTGINVVLTDAGLGMIQSPGVVGTFTLEQA